MSPDHKVALRPHKWPKSVLTELLLLGPWIFVDFASVGLKAHEIGSAANTLVPQWHS